MKRLWFFLLWGTVLGLLIPGVGVIVALLLAVCGGSGKSAGHEAEAQAPSTLPVAVRPQSRMERVSSALDFVPLVEILSGDDVELKRGAIEQLVRLKTPEAIQILLAYRSDSSLEMRYYVNAALSRIKNEFDEELDAARQQMQLDTYKSSARVFLAKIYLQYAHSGLIDAELAQNYENESIFHLTYVMESDAPTAESFRALIDCYLERQQWSQAEAVVARAQDLQILPPSDIDRYQVLVDYYSGRYLRIPQVMAQMKSHGELPHEWQTAALWWGGRS